MRSHPGAVGGGYGGTGLRRGRRSRWTWVGTALLIRLAWRNVTRNWRRTLVILAAISMGLWAMLFYAAFSRGWENDVVGEATTTLTGHLQLHQPGYLDDPSVDFTLAPPSAELSRLLDGEAIAAWAGRVRVPAVVMSSRESLGVTLVGIDPSAERGLSFIVDAVHEGRPLESPEDRGIVLGAELAERLSTGVGKRVVIMSQAADHTVVDEGFVVVGLFDADRQATELGYTFVGRRRAAEMLGLGDRLSEVAVALGDRSALAATLADLRAAAPDLDIQPWNVLEPLSEAILSLARNWIWIFYTVMVIAMAFGLINTLLMAVLERTRELGLLQALGMRSSLILAQVVLESMMLLAFGLALGGLLAAVTLFSLRGGIDVSRWAEGADLWGMGKVIQPALTAADVTSAVAVIGVLGLLASLYPAFRAARRVPVEAITRG